MIDLKAMPPDVELAWRRFEQSFREENERRARAFDEQHRQLLEEISARYADVTIFKPPPEILSVLSPEESARIVKMLRDVERALERLSPELQVAFWNLPLDDDFFDAGSIVLNSNLTDKQHATELETFFARGEVETSWLQLRRVLYPVVKDVNAFDGGIITIVPMFLDDEELFFYGLILLVLSVIYRLGDPAGKNNTLKKR